MCVWSHFYLYCLYVVGGLVVEGDMCFLVSLSFFACLYFGGLFYYLLVSLTTVYIRTYLGDSFETVL